jgi:hypothetical protein
VLETAAASSPSVVGALDGGGRLLVSRYPTRANVHTIQRHPTCSVLVLSDDLDDA